MRRLASEKAWYRLDPLDCIRLSSQVFSLLGEATMVAGRVNANNAPVLLASTALSGVRLLTRLHRRCDDEEEIISDAYLVTQNIYQLGTAFNLRREVSSFGLQPFLLESFDVARAKIEECVVGLPQGQAFRDWSRRTGGFLSNVLAESDNMISTVIFAFGHHPGTDANASTTSALVSFTTEKRLASSISNLTWTAHEIMENFQDLVRRYAAVTSYYYFLDIADKTSTLVPKALYASQSASRGMAIELKDVGVTYPKAKTSALRNVNFSVSPGQLVAIVGHNGSGKSTLISLLARVRSTQKPTVGTLLINGVDIDDYAKEDIFSRMSFTFQTSLTIKQYVGLGCLQYREDHERIEKALDAAGATSDVADLPAGWHTYAGGVVGFELDDDLYTLPRVLPVRPYAPNVEIISEEGKAAKKAPTPGSVDEDRLREISVSEMKKEPLLDVQIVDEEHSVHSTKDPDGNKARIKYPKYSPDAVTMSGGQWQRIVMSRAFMDDRKDLLVFDEPAANLDPAAEASLFDTILKLRGSTTILFSTHRYGITAKGTYSHYSSFQQHAEMASARIAMRPADLILMFAKGELVEQGTHEELMKIEEGEYRRMYLFSAQGFQREEKSTVVDAGDVEE
ncbi:hypothetical protein P7C70_g7245, partial [Phenoliferia sp. Uapishka_3]